VSSFNQYIHELAVDSDVSSLEYSSGEEYDDVDDYPDTPSSTSSRASFTDYSRHHMDWIQYILLWILVPVKFLLGIPFYLFRLAYSAVSKPRSVSENQHSGEQSHLHARVQSLKDQIIHRTTDRRRGIIEVVKLVLSLLICSVYYLLFMYIFVDNSHVHVIFVHQDLHLGMEIFIEAVFDFVHKAVYLLLSPSEAFGKLFRLFSSHERGIEDDNIVVENATIYTATLGENDRTPTERNTDFQQSFSTDARTCQDVITELG
jgi:hypothetical protein